MLISMFLSMLVYIMYSTRVFFLTILLVKVESGTIEFYNHKLENLVSPTLADRRWMEKIVRVVNDTWDDKGNVECDDALVRMLMSLAITRS